MLSKIVLVVISILFLLFSGFYFLNDSSYQDSFEARFYYLIGNYEKAYDFAKKSYDKDPYNKMAFTVLTQSKIATEYVKYIKTGNEYFNKIDKISSKKEYSDADKVRVKLMCEIMLGDYKKLVPTKLTNSDLIKDAKKLDDKFKQLYKELF
ncbi:MAG: hypothetical protein QM482_10105 [Sulfurospirillum sp.]